MNVQTTFGFGENLTYKANLKHTRYGWLRLTPAYSVHLVTQALSSVPNENAIVLDPFMGTGTTALVCGEKGLRADTTDINPFLIWLAKTKSAVYSPDLIRQFLDCARWVSEAITAQDMEATWRPPLHQIEKWWDEQTLLALSRVISAIQAFAANAPEQVIDLLKIAFCRTMIERAHVSFGHQSMSFKKHANGISLYTSVDCVLRSWQGAIVEIGRSAASPILTQPRILLVDARQLSQRLERDYYSCVITSPPYPNRMSYIRELRPYMYWLGYLEDTRSAGELDWQAIGGTWGIATSRVAKWQPPMPVAIPYEGFQEILDRIGETSPVLSQYVWKYFHDMTGHCRELFQVVRPGGTVHYVVGNSKFYDVLLPVEDIFAAMFRESGFQNVTVKTIRKRTSKKELVECIVAGTKRN